MFNTLSTQSFKSTSKPSSESQLFSKVFADFNLSPTVTAIKFDTFHNLIQRTQFKPKACLVCLRPIKCGVESAKCVDCGLHSHTKCERYLSIMCIERQQFKPRNSCRSKKFRYPSKPPFIPPPILHLVNEIELKIESGLYCLPINNPAGKEVISGILRKFYLKKPQHLRRYDVHVLSNCLLQVLRELPSHLIRHWQISRSVGAGSGPPCLKLDLEALPKPNRNVLILLLLHLQYISRQEESRMSLKVLAAIFAPILIENETYPSLADNTRQSQDQRRELAEIAAQNLLLELLVLDSEYLLNVFLNS